VRSTRHSKRRRTGKPVEEGLEKNRCGGRREQQHVRPKGQQRKDFKGSYRPAWWRGSKGQKRKQKARRGKAKMQAPQRPHGSVEAAGRGPAKPTFFVRPNSGSGEGSRRAELACGQQAEELDLLDIKATNGKKKNAGAGTRGIQTRKRKKLPERSQRGESSKKGADRTCKSHLK